MTAADLRSNTARWDEELAAGRAVEFRMSPRNYVLTWLVLLIAGVLGTAQAINRAGDASWTLPLAILAGYVVAVTAVTWLVWSTVAKPIVLRPDGIGLGRKHTGWSEIESVGMESVQDHRLMFMATSTSEHTQFLPAHTGVDPDALVGWLRKKTRQDGRRTACATAPRTAGGRRR